MSNELKGRLRWGVLGLAIVGGVIVGFIAESRGEKILFGLSYIAGCCFIAALADFYSNGEN